MTADKPRVKTLVLDFDNVIHSYVSGWKGVDVIPDPPHKGAMEFVTRMLAQYDVAIMSSRSGTEVGRFAMAKWFVRNGFRADMINWRDCQDQQPAADLVIDDGTPEGLARRFNDMPADMRPPRLLTFPWSKPAAWLSIDDRAVTFNGKWPSVEFIEKFKPWDVRDRKPRKKAEQPADPAQG